jgi:hypothetical protein
LDSYKRYDLLQALADTKAMLGTVKHQQEHGQLRGHAAKAVPVDFSQLTGAERRGVDEVHRTFQDEYCSTPGDLPSQMPPLGDILGPIEYERSVPHN